MDKRIEYVYTLFQTDVWHSISSRVFFGVFSSERAAMDSAKKNDLWSHGGEVEIVECEVDKFEEL